MVAITIFTSESSGSRPSADKSWILCASFDRNLTELALLMNSTILSSISAVKRSLEFSINSSSSLSEISNTGIVYTKYRSKYSFVATLFSLIHCCFSWSEKKSVVPKIDASLGNIVNNKLRPLVCCSLEYILSVSSIILRQYSSVCFFCSWSSNSASKRLPRKTLLLLLIKEYSVG